MRAPFALAVFVVVAVLAPGSARAQPLDMTGGGPVEVTSTDGIEWRQEQQVVVARGSARAIRDGVTIEADRLIARYRNRSAAAPGAVPASAQPAGQEGAASPMSGGEIWRLEAEGNVRISSQTDRAQGDRAVYDMDQAVMVITGQNLSLASPENTISARDSLEYWPNRRMAVARGAARVNTSDNRQIAADTLVGYFLENAAAPPPAARAGTTPQAAPPPGTRASARPVPGEGSKLDRVEIFGNVEIRTEAEVVRGDRGVYAPQSGIARLLGNVRITRGQNQLNGAEAVVNMRSGVSRLVSAPGNRVQGLILPGSGNPAAGPAPTPSPAPAPQRQPEVRR